MVIAPSGGQSYFLEEGCLDRAVSLSVLVLPKSQESSVLRQSSIPAPIPSVECVLLILGRHKSAPGPCELFVLGEVRSSYLLVRSPHKRPCSPTLDLLPLDSVPKHPPATHPLPLVLMALLFEQGSDLSVWEDSGGTQGCLFYIVGTNTQRLCWLNVLHFLSTGSTG